jgi:hypothetical protein
VPRVLVTNGKPFLPRLTRHVQHQNFSKQLVLRHTNTSSNNVNANSNHGRLPTPPHSHAFQASLWDRFLESDAIASPYSSRVRKKRNAKASFWMKLPLLSLNII